MTPRNDTLYAAVIIVIGVIAVAAISGVIALALLSERDNTILIGIIFAGAAPTITGLLGLVKSAQNSTDIAETKRVTTALAIDVNGRLSQLLAARAELQEAKTEAAHSAGILVGTQEERDRAAPLPPIV